MRSWVADTVQSIAGVDIVGSGARPVGGTASIGAVTISGPARIKRGRAYTYRATIVNFGDAEATGVRLRISGRGIRFNGLVGSVAPISSRTVSFRLRSFGVGRSRVSFSVVSNNAGSKTVRKTINVRR
jgi:hypothetical protein